MIDSRQEYRDWRDFKAMHRGEEGARAGFERACEILLRKMYTGLNVQSVRPSPGDEGIDVFVGELGIAPIMVFQCKFFLERVGEPQRQQIRVSFRRAIDSGKYALSKWTLCIPTTLTIDEHSWWANWSNKQTQTHKIPIDLIDGNALLALMKFYGVYNLVFEVPEVRPRYHTTPVADTSVIRAVLKAKYTDLLNSQITPFYADYTPMPIADCYINLAIVNEPAQKRRERDLARHDATTADATESTLPGLLGSWEDIHAPKGNIDLDDILDINQNGKRARRHLVLGRAGIGKSTFCQRIANQWAVGALWPGKFKYVFWLRLRNLQDGVIPQAGTADLLDILLHECCAPRLGTEARPLLSEIVAAELDDALFLLDGYDEATDIPHLLKRMVNEQILSFPHVILTSRPGTALPLLDARLEILGFTDDNIRAYIQMFFEQKGAPERGADLLRVVEQNPGVRGCAHIPINLELMCSLRDDQQLPQHPSVTRLYGEMVTMLCRRYLRDRQGTDTGSMTDRQVKSECGVILHTLRQLAYRGMETGALILKTELLEEVLDCGSRDVNVADMLRAGFLKPTRDTSLSTKNEYYFLHLSFQEFLAAEWLSRQGLEAIRAFLAENKYDTRYETMIGFLAGILSLTSDASGGMSLRDFLDVIEEEPRDIIGLRHHLLLIHCLEQCISDAGSLGTSAAWDGVLGRLCRWVDQGREQGGIRFALRDRVARYPAVFGSSPVLGVFLDILRAEREDPYNREFAAAALGDLGRPTREIVDALVSWLRRGLLSHWVPAAQSLGELGVVNRNVVDALAWKIRGCDKESDCNEEAAIALAKLGQISELARIVLSSIREDSTAPIGARIAGKIAAARVWRDKKALTNLIDAFMDGRTDKMLRWTICYSFSRIGWGESTTCPALSSVVMDRHMEPDLRSRAAEALGAIGRATEEVVEALLVLLNDQSVHAGHRRSAAKALGGLRHVGEAATLALVSVIETQAGLEFCEYAAAALREIQDVSEAGKERLYAILQKRIPRLEIVRRTCTQDEMLSRVGANLRFRIIAAEALGGIGERDQAINGLLSIVTDSDDLSSTREAQSLAPFYGMQAIYALDNIGGVDHDADVIETVARFGQENDLYRSEIPQILGKYDLSIYVDVIRHMPLKYWAACLRSTPLSVVAMEAFGISCAGRSAKPIEAIVENACRGGLALWIDREANTLRFVEYGRMRSVSIPDSIDTAELEADIRRTSGRFLKGVAASEAFS